MTATSPLNSNTGTSVLQDRVLFRSLGSICDVQIKHKHTDEESVLIIDVKKCQLDHNVFEVRRNAAQVR